MAAEQDRLEGEIIAFQFRADDRGFAVGKLRLGSGEVTVVGTIGHVLEGQHVQVQGHWKTHAQFGRQFQVERVLVEDPRTISGLEKYLGSGAIKGLGPGFAKRVVETFGLDTLRVIEEDPERLLQVDGIGKKRLTDIVSHYVRDRRDREVMATLRGWGIGQGLATRIVERFGGDALQIVTRHPFRLLEVRGVGFKTADALAAEHGIAKDAPERIEAALQYVLEEARRSRGTRSCPSTRCSPARRISRCRPDRRSRASIDSSRSGGSSGRRRSIRRSGRWRSRGSRATSSSSRTGCSSSRRHRGPRDPTRARSRIDSGSCSTPSSRTRSASRCAKA
jgi:hypothetical protein